jgi:hypothetical protein
MKNLLCGIVLFSACSGIESLFFEFNEQITPTVTNDQFSDSIEILGISKIDKTHFKGSGIAHFGTSFNYFLRSFVAKEDLEIASHSIYTQFYSYGTGWLHLYRASIEGGLELDVLEGGSDVSCSSGSCSYYETISITMPEELLLDHINSGISVKVYGKSGHSFVINLSPEQISEQFKAIETL